jgi:hypothetical protein
MLYDTTSDVKVPQHDAWHVRSSTCHAPYGTGPLAHVTVPLAYTCTCHVVWLTIDGVLQYAGCWHSHHWHGTVLQQPPRRPLKMLSIGLANQHIPAAMLYRSDPDREWLEAQ